MTDSSTDKNQTITYDYITKNDFGVVMSHLKACFYKDEPLNNFLHFDDCKDLEDYCLHSLAENCSFKAVDENGNIAGVIINGIIKKPDPSQAQESLASQATHDGFRKIMQMMDYIDTKFNMFELYPKIDKYLDGKIFSVDPKYRGMGIAGKLVDKTFEFMKQNKIQVMYVLCTSAYSARVVEKMNFQEVYHLNYADFHVDGKQLLNPAKPHVAARIFTKEIF